MDKQTSNSRAVSNTNNLPSKPKVFSGDRMADVRRSSVPLSSGLSTQRLQEAQAAAYANLLKNRRNNLSATDLEQGAQENEIDSNLERKVAASKLAPTSQTSSFNQFEESEGGGEKIGTRNLTRDEKIAQGLIEATSDDVDDPSVQQVGTKKGGGVYEDTSTAREKAKERVAKKEEESGEGFKKANGNAKEALNGAKNNIGGTAKGKVGADITGKSKVTAGVTNNLKSKALNTVVKNPTAAKAVQLAANVKKARQAATIIRLIWVAIASWPIWITLFAVLLVVVVVVTAIGGHVTQESQQYGGTEYTQGDSALNNINPESAAVSDVELMPAIMRQINIPQEGGDLLDTSTEEVRTRYGKAGDVNNRNQVNSARLAALTVEAISNVLNTGNQYDNETNQYKDTQQEVLKRAFESEGDDRVYEPLESRSLSYPYIQNKPAKKDDVLDPVTKLPVANRPLIGKEQAKIIQSYLKEEIAKASGKGVMSLDGNTQGNENSEKKPEDITNLTGFKSDEVKVLIDGLKVNLGWDNDQKKYVGNIYKTYASATDTAEDLEFTDISKYFSDSNAAKETGTTDKKIAIIDPVRAEKRTAVYETLGHAPVDRGVTPEGIESILKVKNTENAAGIEKKLTDLGYTNDDLINETFGSFVKGRININLEMDDTTGSTTLLAKIINWVIRKIKDYIVGDLWTWQFPTYTNRFYEIENWKRKTLTSLDRFNPNNELYTVGNVQYDGPMGENGGTYTHLKDRSAVFNNVVLALKELFGLDLTNNSIKVGEDAVSNPAVKIFDMSKEVPAPGSLKGDEDPQKVTDEQIAEQGQGIFDIIKDKIDALQRLFTSFSAADEERPIYKGETVDDILAQAMKDLRGMDLNRTVQGINFYMESKVVVKYYPSIEPPFIIVESVEITPPSLSLNYAKKVISNGPNNEEVLNLINATQKAVLRSVVNEDWQNMENKDKRGYVEPINIANNGAFLFGQEQVDKYIAQLEEFREKVRKRQYTDNTSYAYGAVNALNYTGSGSARPWDYIVKNDPEYVEYLNSLGINNKADYYTAAIIAEFAAQGVVMDDSPYADPVRNAQAAKLIGTGVAWAAAETSDENGQGFVKFRQLDPLTACNNIYNNASSNDCLPPITEAANDPVKFIVDTVVRFFATLIQKLMDPSTWSFNIIKDMGNLIASLATSLTETYGALGKGVVDTVWTTISDKIKDVKPLKVGDVSAKITGRAQDITIGMISGFDTFGNDKNYALNDDSKSVIIPGSTMNQYIPDGETGVTYDGRGFLPNSFTGKKMYEKFQENYLTGVDLMKNPNLIAQNQDDLADVSLAAFILVRNIINGDINSPDLDNIKRGAGTPITLEQYKNAIKAMKGNSVNIDLVKGGSCVAIPFMGKTNNYLNTGITLKGGGDVVAYNTGDVIHASFGGESGTLVIRTPDPTGRNASLIIRYTGLDPKYDPLQIKEKFDKLGKPKLETVKIRADEVIGKPKNGQVKVDFISAIVDTNNQVDYETSSLFNPLYEGMQYLNLDKYKMCDGASDVVGISQFFNYDYSYTVDRTTPRAKRTQQASFNF